MFSRAALDATFRFHFGPYLAIAALIALFWGEPIAALVATGLTEL